MHSHPHALANETALSGGRYRVDFVLGQGGFGITYCATDTKLQRRVAIKEFFLGGSHRDGTTVRPPPHLVEQFTERKDRIRDEARALARFRHPSIVTVHEYFEENDTIYVVMEMLDGRTLHEVLQSGPLPEDVAIRHAAEIGAALDAVHAENLLHRDVKPDNVMVMDDGHVALVDFGTAREFALGQSSLMSQTLTPGYAPVEQYTAQGRFGPQTDVYALGATVYHMVTGQFPTPSLDRYTGHRLQPPHEVNPAVGTQVSEAIMWAMAVDSQDRPPSAGAFVAALQGEAVAEPVAPGATRVVAPPPGVAPAAWGTRTVGAPEPAPPAAPPPSPPPAQPTPPSKTRRQVRRGARRIGRILTNLAITVGVGIAATIAVMWWVDRNENPGPTPPPAPTATTAAPGTTLDGGGGTTTGPTVTTPPTLPPIGQEALFDVVDIAADDVLNVRAGPGVAFDPPLAGLPPGAQDVAVTGNVANIGRSFWAEVVGPDVTGWASLTYLENDVPGAEQAIIDRLRTTVLGVALSEPGVWRTAGSLEILRGPGDQYEGVGGIGPGTPGIRATGDTALVDGVLWAQVAVPGGGEATGWVRAEGLDLASQERLLGQPRGLFCRDLEAAGFDYAYAYAYWVWEGRTDRMNENRDEVPCETVYSPADIAFHLSVLAEG